MSGTIRIPDMPNLGTPTDDTLFVADHAGSGVFTGAVVRDYVLAGGASLTVGTLHVTGIGIFDGPLGSNSNITTTDNVVADGLMQANGGFWINTGAPIAFSVTETGDSVLALGANTYMARDHGSGAIKWAMPGHGDVLEIDPFTGSLLVKGGPASQIGIFGDDGYLTLNGSHGFSTAGSSSLVINGGSRPTYAFEFFSNGSRMNAFAGDGSAYKPGGGSWADISDERIKTNVSDYTHGLTEVMQLRARSYSYIEEAGRGDAVYIGLIAQECETAMPEMVTQRPADVGGVHYDDMRFVDTTALVFALLNTVQELVERVMALEGAAR